MKIAVIVVWRPKNYPEWTDRSSATRLGIPGPLRNYAGAAPYTGVHLASLFPSAWHVTVIHEMVRDVSFDVDVDAVFLSTMDYCAHHARDLASEFRKRKVLVIVGGLYPTLNPGYFQDVADTVVVGEAEPIWPQLLKDLQARRLKARYGSATPANMSSLPPPNYEHVERNFKVTMAYEATRGCPFRCSFCVLSAIRQPYRRRPIPNVIRDVSAIPSHWNWTQRKYLIFWDNNIGADRHYFRDLCEAIRPLKRIWGAETSIDTVSRETARMIGKAGCRSLYIGLESLAEDSLLRANKGHNKIAEYKQRLRWLHENGVIVMSIFLIGLDGDSSEYLARLPELIHDIGVDVPVYSFVAPIEGTTFYKELRSSGRLLQGDILDQMDGMSLTYSPQTIPAEELESALLHCMRESYRTKRVLSRIAKSWTHGFWNGLANSHANLFFLSHQRALARSGEKRFTSRGPWPGFPPSAVGQTEQESV